MTSIFKKGSPAKPVSVQIKRNRFIVICTFFVAVIMPAIGWFGLKDFLPATRAEIVRLDNNDIVLEIKILKNDISDLEGKREDLILKKLENGRLQTEVKKELGKIPPIYLEELAAIESKIEKIDRQIAIKQNKIETLENKE